MNKALRIAGLLVFTLLAIGLMGLVSTGSLRRLNPDAAAPEAVDLAANQPVPVAVMEVEQDQVAIVSYYSGMIRPWRRYTLSFEAAGRIESLGVGPAGKPLDDGDRVHKGQLLARLDDRVLRARESETAARLEQATSDYDRVKKVESRKIGAISDADVQQQLTALATAKAEHQMAVKNLEDAQLVAPVDAVISKRLVNPGESVAAHVPAFELVEVDQVLLVLGVPESDIPEIQDRMRKVQQAASLPEKTASANEDLKFTATVHLISRNRFDQDHAELSGTVYRISETADDRTGLFEVEILLRNEEHRLRPGMIARADLVIKHVLGWSIPASSVIAPNKSKGQQANGPLEEFVFTFEPDLAAETKSSLAESTLGRARRVDLLQWVEQRNNVVVTKTKASASIDHLIWRGQHRLIDGQRVKRIPFPRPSGEE